MKQFKTFISEGSYPIWVRVTVGSLVLAAKRLSHEIERESDPVKQNQLLAKQNKIVAYINGLGIGVSSSDTVLIRQMKKFGTK